VHLTSVEKKKLRQELENIDLEQPYTLSELKVAQILRERAWTARERLDELQCK
jgi:hypothetical protein